MWLWRIFLSLKMIDYKQLWDVIEGFYHLPLSAYKCFSFSGEDVKRFLGGQLTQDIELLSKDCALYSARLNGKGQIVSWQILFEHQSVIHVMIERDLASDFKSDLEKYIIMDDVEIHEVEQSFKIVFGIAATSLPGPWLLYYGLPAKIVESTSIKNDFKNLDAEVEDLLKVYSAWPIWNKTLTPLTLVNETIFETIGISYKKGCFLGQETAAKIHNRRGASYAPALLIGNDPLDSGAFQCMERKGGVVIAQTQSQQKYIHLCQLFREFRIDSFEIEVGGSQYEVATTSAPFQMSRKDWAEKIFDRGTDYFNGDKEGLALELLKLSLELDPTFADAYEVVGVILGRHEKYQEAIDYMDKLSEVDPHSVMAHTNKSLYLMKLGNITGAEEEKSKATVKTFERFGREAQSKREKEKQLEVERAETQRRFSMFNQVLEIDPEDEIALYGLGDLAFAAEDFQVALDYFKKVLLSNPSHSRSYLMAGKCLEKLEQKSEARQMYQTGMSVATKAGELMPATEMRTRLVALN